MNRCKSTLKAYLHKLDESKTVSTLQLASFYTFPDGDGYGQTIGVVELGGGYRKSDIIVYLSDLGITNDVSITDVRVQGASNNPNHSDATSVVLDIETLLAIAPKSKLRVYFAPNTMLGFYSAIKAAIYDKCNIISISWGIPETELLSTPTILTAFNDLLKVAVDRNISVFCASGGGVDFPACCPNITACGGTSVNIENNTEKAWEGSVGGVSKFFFKPTYQTNILINSRGIPDVSGSATGHSIYQNGNYLVVGGTGAVASMWSGLMARINQNLHTFSGFINNKVVYISKNVCKDVTAAKTGWDVFTGNGSPMGIPLQTYIQSIIPVTSFTANPVTGNEPLTVQFLNTSTNATTVKWSFGSLLDNPEKAYSRGSYDVTLTATNSMGSATCAKTTIVVHPRLSPSFTYVREAMYTYTFTDTSIGNPSSWYWSFGDTKTSTSNNPTHVFSAAGIYTITLKINNKRVVSKNIRIN